MGLLDAIKNNSRRISDAVAGGGDYFELATTNLSLYRSLRRVAEKHAQGRLLDAGAGRMAYRRMLEGVCDVYESLDVAGEGIDRRADLQDTGLPDGDYDTIFCTQVLQHLPEPGRAVAEIARLLRPGGKAIFSVPHLVWLHNEPRDYMRFTHHAMRHLIEKAGMRVIETEKVGGLICFLAYAPSTILLALLWPVRPLFRPALWANRLFIRCALFLDAVFGVKELYPTNFVVVAEKPPE